MGMRKWRRDSITIHPPPLVVVHLVASLWMELLEEEEEEEEEGKLPFPFRICSKKKETEDRNFEKERIRISLIKNCY